MKHLLEGEYNCRELAALTELHYVTVLEYTRALHAAKVIYICKWERDARGRDAIKVYKFGNQPDAPRRVLGRAEQQRRYRERKRMGAVIRAMDDLSGENPDTPIPLGPQTMWPFDPRPRRS